MSIFKNKEDFKDRPKVYDILTALEKAHARQDELACAILLTKLKNENITLKHEEIFADAENACTENESTIQ